jgi:hypothetical protein
VVGEGGLEMVYHVLQGLFAEGTEKLTVFEIAEGESEEVILGGVMRYWGLMRSKVERRWILYLFWTTYKTYIPSSFGS